MKHFVKIVKYLLFSACIMALLLGAAYWMLKENIHTVVPHQVYRSAELTPNQFKKLIKKENIKSMINLRGANPDKKWYQDELQISQQLGVKHYDVALNSTILPKPEDMKKLAHFLEIAPEPILLHCEGGADRTGFAAAAALLLRGKSVAESEKQISIYYFVISKKSIGRTLLPMYQRWLEQNHLQSSRSNFLKWINL
jgi:protein tyrosine phosphatase (PTP) superfamily phosphohydrolase (DUF442 family)